MVSQLSRTLFEAPEGVRAGNNTGKGLPGTVSGVLIPVLSCMCARRRSEVVRAGTALDIGIVAIGFDGDKRNTRNNNKKGGIGVPPGFSVQRATN